MPRCIRQLCLRPGAGLTTLLRAKRERWVPFETVPSFMSIFVTDDRAPGGIRWMMCIFARLELLILFVRMPLLNQGQAFTTTFLFPQS